MGAPGIGEQALYEVPVMWLDGISIDSNVVDPADKRYSENKRNAALHSKGWEYIWAEAIDAPVAMTHVGNYLKIPVGEKAMIIARIQSWILVDHEKGLLLPAADLPIVPPKQKLRPGQRKKLAKPPPIAAAKPKAKTPMAKLPARVPPKKTKQARKRRASSSEGVAPTRAHLNKPAKPLLYSSHHNPLMHIAPFVQILMTLTKTLL
jgi:hypothetical protein